MTRIYLYDKYKLFFWLEKNTIQAYGVYNPDAITPGIEDKKQIAK